MDSDYLLNTRRSFIRSCVTGPPATDTVLIDITDPPDTTLKGGLALLCSQEVTPGMKSYCIHGTSIRIAVPRIYAKEELREARKVIINLPYSHH